MSEVDPAAPRARLLGASTDAGSLADRVELRAATLYESQYWCAESVLKSVNEAIGEPLPPQITKLASGFCEGFGGSRCTCGALAGAVMAAGLFCGREGPTDAWEPSYDVAGELRRRFVEDQNASTCEGVVSAIGDMDSPERWAHCTELVGRCARWVIEIAEAEGWLAECAHDGTPSPAPEPTMPEPATSAMPGSAED
jgi:C_GCAxxG_C_C family probable redox protein